MLQLPDFATKRVFGLPVRSLALVILFAISCWTLWSRWNMLFQHRTELGGVEHNVVHGIQKLVLGETLYQDPEAVPFDVIQYTPAYYVVCAGLAKVLGLEGDDVRSIYILGRTVSLFFNLLTCWFVYLGCRIAGAPKWASFFATGLAFAAYWEQFFARMDSLAAAATFAAFYFMLRWILQRRDIHLVACGVLAVCACMAKQSGITAMAIPVLYILLERQWKALGMYVLTVVICLLISFAATFNWLGTPWAMYQNTVVGLTNGFSKELFASLFAPAMYKYFIGWHILAVIIVYVGWRSPSPAIRFLALAVPFSLTFALVTGMKYGSRLNYLHESLTLSFMGGAILLSTTPTVRMNILAWCFTAYGTLFAAFRANSVQAWCTAGEPDELQARLLAEDLAVRDILVNELHLQKQEKVFITYREYLEHLLVGQSMLTQKDIVLYSNDRLFDYSAFHRAMHDGTIRFVITDKPNEPVVYLDSTYTDWRPIRTVNGRTILARNPVP